MPWEGWQYSWFFCWRRKLQSARSKLLLHLNKSVWSLGNAHSLESEHRLLGPEARRRRTGSLARYLYRVLDFVGPPRLRNRRSHCRIPPAHLESLPENSHPPRHAYSRTVLPAWAPGSFCVHWVGVRDGRPHDAFSRLTAWRIQHGVSSYRVHRIFGTGWCPRVYPVQKGKRLFEVEIQA